MPAKQYRTVTTQLAKLSIDRSGELTAVLYFLDFYKKDKDVVQDVSERSALRTRKAFGTV